MVAAAALPGNPYDGHTLAACTRQAQRVSGIKATEIYTDRGYRGHGCVGYHAAATLECPAQSTPFKDGAGRLKKEVLRDD